MATPLAIVVPIPKGAWNSTAVYNLLNVVTHDGRGYICKAAGSGIEPTPTGNSQWQLIADKGQPTKFEDLTQAQKDNLAQSANAAANEAKEYAQAVKILLDNLVGSDNPSAALTAQVAKNTAAIGELGPKVGDAEHIKTSEKGFFLVDSEKRVAAQYTQNGFDVAKISEHFKSLVKAIEGIGLEIGETLGTAYDGKSGKDTADALTRLTGVVQDMKNMLAFVSERGFFFTDASDLVGFKYDANGLDAAKVSSHFKSLVGGGGGSGLSETSKSLLIQILQSGVYVNAESNDKINQLIVELNK